MRASPRSSLQPSEFPEHAAARWNCPTPLTAAFQHQYCMWVVLWGLGLLCMASPMMHLQACPGASVLCTLFLLQLVAASL